MIVELKMKMTIDPAHELEIAKLEHHIDWLLSLDEWPEITSVYGVRASVCRDDGEDNMSNEGWFGIVRWCDDDIAAKLEEMGIEPTEENISEIRCRCENNHHFTDTMIESGWEAIECEIYDMISKNENEQLRFL